MDTKVLQIMMPEGPYRGCGGLEENGSHWLIHLSAWSLDGETVWKGLEGVALLSEVWMWEVRHWEPTPFLVSSLCLWPVDKLQHHASLPAAHSPP